MDCVFGGRFTHTYARTHTYTHTHTHTPIPPHTQTSDTRGQLVRVLESCGYTYQEFLLTPNQFSVPNQRLRYFLLVCKETPFRVRG